MSLTDLRLLWRQQGFELAVLVGGCVLLAILSLGVAWRIGVLAADLRACYTDAPDSSAPGWPCRETDAWFSRLSVAATVLGGIAGYAPFAVGVLLGAPLVAREIERRTAPLAWSLSTSRPRWLARRALPVLGLMAAALLAVGAGGEALIRATSDDVGFASFGSHGPLVAVRGAAVLAIGTLVGLVIGRVLPAILVTGLAVGALMGGLEIARTELMRAEAVWLDMERLGASGSYVFDSGFRVDATGELITYDEAFERYPEVFTPTGSNYPPGTTMVARANPPEQYPWFVAREAAAMAIVALVAAAGSAIVAGRRRPE